jgi:hypothetical protein
MPKLGLDRQQLARFFQNNAEAIRAFEKVFDSVDSTPTTVEEVAALAGTAAALGNLALTLITSCASLLEQLGTAPVALPATAADDFTPAIAVGTLGQQNADAVAITGGSIDATPIGAATASTGAFTTLTASGAVALSPANANVTVAPTGTGTVTVNPAVAGAMNNMDIGAVTPKTVKGSTVQSVGGFGCNGKTPQTAVAVGAALAAYAAGANGLSTGAAMSALVAKVQAIDTALIANGITV